MSEGSYIRGAGAVEVDPRRIGLLLALAAVVALAVSTIVLGVATASDKSRAERLQARGVPVQVTVTGCSAITSGIGMGVEYYDCRGSYELAGVSAQALIRGNRVLLQTGQVLQAVAVPGDPSSLSLRKGGGGSWTATVALGSVTVACGVMLLAIWWRRRHPAVS